MTLRFAPGVIIGFVIVAYFVYNFFFSVNFPFQDDFLLIQFIQAILEGKSDAASVTRELFRTFNDHKAVVPRLIALIEYTLTGHLNFRFYIVLVSINVIYIFHFVYLQFRKMQLPLYYFIPVPFLFFHPLFHDVSGWALNGMQHTFLTAFTVTAIMLAASRMRGAFYVAMLCCFLATFTHGNGVLSFPAIVFYYLCTRNFPKAGLTCVFMIACLGLYLGDYESGQAVQLPKSIGSFILSFFGFIGSEMSLWSYPEVLSLIWGLMITAMMVYVAVPIVSNYFNKTWAPKPGTVELLTLFAFIVATSLVVALFRSWTGSTIASRFQLYAALSTILFYIFLVYKTQLFRKKGVLVAVSVLSVAYWVYSHYQFTGVVANKKTTYLADVYNWSVNRTMFSVENTLQANAEFYLRPAYENGFFRLPQPLAGKAQLDSMFTAHPAADEDFKMFVENWKVDRLARDGNEVLDYFFITSHHAPAPKPLLWDRFLVLRNAGRIELMASNPKTEGRKKLLTGGAYYKPGFNTLVRSDDLAAGTYELGLLDVAPNGDRTFYRLDKKLLVRNGWLSLQ